MAEARVSLPVEVATELQDHLRRELAFYTEVDGRFRKKYRTRLEGFEARIQRRGVPPGRYGLWEDSIEWRNAVEEAARLRALLRGVRG